VSVCVCLHLGAPACAGVCVFVYVCTCVFVHAGVTVPVFRCLWVRVPGSSCLCAWVSPCVSVLWVWSCVCMRLCLSDCWFVGFLFVYVSASLRECACVCVCVHLYVFGILRLCACCARVLVPVHP